MHNREKLNKFCTNLFLEKLQTELITGYVSPIGQTVHLHQKSINIILI